MKKVFIYSFVVAALLTAASCKKENSEVDYLPATISQYQGGKDAKVFLDANHVAYWNASGDVVNLNGVPSAVYPDGNYYKIAVNAQARGNEYYAIFPHEYVTSATDHTVNLPTVQKYTETNGKQRINALMAAHGTTRLEFKNLCGLLEVTVAGLGDDQHLTRIEVSTVGGTTPLAGSGSISLTTSGAPVLTMSSGGSPTTVLQFDENGHHDGTYYIAVPPVSGQKFKIRIMYRQPDASHNTVITYSKTYTQTNNCSLHASKFGSISTPDITTNPVDHLPGGFTTPDGVVYFSRGVVKCVNPTNNSDPSRVEWTFENNQYSATAYTASGPKAKDFNQSGFMPYSTEDSHAGFPILDNSNSGAFWDWGDHYGNNSHWETLSRAEWTYLLSTRSASTINGVENARYAYAKVNGQYGLILFPDIFSWPTPASNAPTLISNTCINTTNVAVNNAPNYGLADWKELEDAGCVFLPALGYYDYHGSTGNFVNASTNQGWYWTSDAVGGTSHDAFCMKFPNVVSYPQESMGYGMLVRLVYRY